MREVDHGDVRTPVRHAARPANPRISVVVPVRNEARNLEIVLPARVRAVPSVHEVIVVDGHPATTPWPPPGPPCRGFA